jgi:Zn-dependent protease with chaperone function
VALQAPATLAQSPRELPWTLTGGRGIFGLDPVTGAIVLWLGLMAFIVLFVLLAAVLSRWSLYRLNRADRRAAVEEAEASPRPAS